MSVRRVRLPVLALVALVLLPGCAGDDEVTQDPRASPSATGVPDGRPSQLAGQWDVTGPGVPAKTILTLGAREAVAFLDCGYVDGSWTALAGGVFLADLYGGDEECFDDENPYAPTPSWLYDATSFVVDGKSRELRDSKGRVVAVLSPAAARPDVPEHVIDDVVEPPTLSEEERAELDRTPPAFPPGIRPATLADLLGTWVLPGETGKGSGWPYVTFKEDLFGGSDGCNGTGGRFALVDGVFLAIEGDSTLVGCENIDITSGAALLGLDGDTLVTFGKDGQEIRRAVRGPAPKTR